MARAASSRWWGRRPRTARRRCTLTLTLTLTPTQTLTPLAAFAPYPSVEYTAAAIDDLVAHPVGKAYLGVLCTFCLLVMLLVL